MVTLVSPAAVIRVLSVIGALSIAASTPAAVGIVPRLRIRVNVELQLLSLRDVMLKELGDLLASLEKSAG